MDLGMILRGWPFVEEGKTQTVTVIVNGNVAGSIDFEPGHHGYLQDVHAAMLVAGWNRFVFRYAYHRPFDPPDRRRLAVAWDSIELMHPSFGHQAPLVTTVGEQPALVLPPGSQVDYFLQLGTGTRLEVERLAWPDGREAKPEEATFEVEVEAEGAPARVAPRLEREQDGPWKSPLDVGDPKATRVTLRLANAIPGDGRALTLVRPRLSSANGAPGIPPPAAEPWSAGWFTARPNVIVYLVDTLRADHLGCYGYERDTSPHLDRFAAEAVLFTRTVAQSPWTRASVASIFTGLRPQRHGANRRQDALSKEAITLAELLHEHGYETAAIVTNHNVSPELGFGQGFERYEMLGRRDGQPIPSSEVTERSVQFLRGRRDGRPLFLYLHTLDPHGPYDPPQPYRARFASGVNDPWIGSVKMLRGLQKYELEPTVDETTRRQLVDLYDGDIAANDASFGALVESLRSLDLYHDSLIVFVSDHGEEF
jgi:hypothetical protein